MGVDRKESNDVLTIRGCLVRLMVLLWVGIAITTGAESLSAMPVPPSLPLTTGVSRGEPELAITRVSINPNGEQGNGISSGAALSADGRWVAFSSSSYNLTDEDQSPVEDIFVHDLETGALAILSTVAVGESQDGDSRAPRITADGAQVVWESMATNLVAGDTNDAADIFLRPRGGGAIVRLSLNGAGEEGNGMSWSPDISADGSVVAFTGSADNLVAGDTNGNPDIFVVELTTPLYPASLYTPYPRIVGRAGETLKSPPSHYGEGGWGVR